MIGRALGCVVVFGGLMAGASVQAHHSTAGVYDTKAEKEITGTLTKLQFVNPHGSMTITVKNADGTTTDWTFTTGSATALAERGISKVGPNALKIGEQLTVKFIPARNGSPLGGLKTIKRADGTVMNIPPEPERLVNRALELEITMASRKRMMWTTCRDRRDSDDQRAVPVERSRSKRSAGSRRQQARAAKVREGRRRRPRARRSTPPQPAQRT